MATPVGHSIMGYVLAKRAGVQSRTSLALSIAAACLPDSDMLLGYVANGDPFSVHREETHRPAFAFFVGGVTAAAVALMRRTQPTSPEALRPAAVATALVASHVVMDRLRLPYDTMSPRSLTFQQAAVTHAWNAVIDFAIYGGLAMLLLGRSRQGQNGD